MLILEKMYNALANVNQQLAISFCIYSSLLTWNNAIYKHLVLVDQLTNVNSFDFKNIWVNAKINMN